MRKSVCVLLCAALVGAVPSAVAAGPVRDGVKWTGTGRGGGARYGLGASLHLPIRSFDGTLLDGWVHLPDVPDGTRVPVVLDASPYWGNANPSAGEIESATTAAAGVAFRAFVERGYAVALYNTRGSGNSQGCTDLLGPNERRDMKVLVEDLAQRPFSSGRVATVGKSYPGSMALAAAAEQAKGLRLVIAANPMVDLHLALFTPQGAAINIAPPTWLMYQGHTVPPPVDRSGRSTHGTLTAGYPGAAAGNVCPEANEQVRTTTLELGSDERDERFWRNRRLQEGLAQSRVPVLLATGFHDSTVWNFQELDAWAALRGGPRRLLLSQGDHTWPQREGFTEEMFAWLDHYLRGIGDEPATVGSVEYQDAGGRWHRDHTWPPAARDQVLYLGGAALRPKPGGSDRRYVSTPDAVNHTATEEFLTTEPGHAAVCPGSGDGTTTASFVSEPVGERTVLAGHPMAYLNLTSDQPGGIVEVALYKVPAGGCGAEGTRYFGSGMADLRFHRGGFSGSDFPVGTPTHVRVDVNAIAETLEPGERLLVALSGGESIPNRPYSPQITVHAGGAVPSQLVLPVVQGGLGGAKPTADYPPRPHALERRQGR